jgi:hypothetical protein
VALAEFGASLALRVGINGRKAGKQILKRVLTPFSLNEIPAATSQD